MKKKNDIKVAIISIIALILVFLILLFTSKFNWGNDQEITIKFNNIKGVSNGTSVLINGIIVGRVDNILLVNDGAVVLASINKDLILKEDCYAEIVMAELTGGKNIEIAIGSSEINLSTNDTIRGVNAGDLSVVLNNFENLSKSATKLIDNINTIVENSGDKLNTLIDDAITITSGAKELDLKNSVSKVDHILDVLISTIDNNQDKVNDIITKFDYISGDMTGLIVDVRSTMGNANTSLNKINLVLGDVQSGGGIIGRMIYDTTLSNKIDNLIDSLSGFATQVKQKGINTNVRLGHKN